MYLFRCYWWNNGSIVNVNIIQRVSNEWILYKVTCGGRAGASPEWTVCVVCVCVCVWCVSTAPSVCVCVCVCPLLQVCVCVWCVCPLLQVVCGVCVCPLLQVCVCVCACVCLCVCVHCSRCVCALGWVKYREHISLLVILCIIVYVTIFFFKYRLSFFFKNRYPIMVKCLNIGENIGKPIYRSISTTNHYEEIAENPSTPQRRSHLLPFWSVQYRHHDVASVVHLEEEDVEGRREPQEDAGSPWQDGQLKACWEIRQVCVFVRL